MVNKKANDKFEILVKAETTIQEKVETMAKNMNKSEHVAPLDACTCTGNCHQLK